MAPLPNGSLLLRNDMLKCIVCIKRCRFQQNLYSTRISALHIIQEILEVQKDSSAPSLKFGKVTHLKTLHFEHRTYPTCNDLKCLIRLLSQLFCSVYANKKIRKYIYNPNTDSRE